MIFLRKLTQASNQAERPLGGIHCAVLYKIFNFDHPRTQRGGCFLIGYILGLIGGQISGRWHFCWGGTGFCCFLRNRLLWFIRCGRDRWRGIRNFFERGDFQFLRAVRGLF